MVYSGVIQYFQKNNIKFKHITGTSIGAFFGTIIALGLESKDVDNLCNSVVNNKELTTFNYKDIVFGFDNYGFFDSDRCIYVIKDIIKDLTFLDFAKKTGINLILCATRIKTMKPIYFSVDNTPNVLVSDALRASMAIPYVIKPVKIGDEYYIDGGLTENVAYNSIPQEEIKNALVLHIKAKHEIDKNPMANKTTYFTSLLTSYYRHNTGYTYLDKFLPNYCLIDDCPISFFPIKKEKNGFILNVSEECIKKSKKHGYNRIEKYITIKRNTYNLNITKMTSNLFV